MYLFMRLSLKFLDLQFPEEEKEHGFVTSRMPFLITSLQVSSVMLFLVVVFSILGVVQGDTNQSPVLFVLCLDGLSLIASFALFFYIRRYRRQCTPVQSGDHSENNAKSHERPEHFEKLAVAFAMWLIFFVCFSTHWRSARLFGVDPEIAWNRDGYTDSTFLMGLMSIVVGVGVFYPIRLRHMTVVSIAAFLSFALTSTILGSPEKPWILTVNGFMIIVLSSMVLMGAWMTEARERSRFNEAVEMRKEMVTEKVTRFGLEHQIAQARAAGNIIQGSTDSVSQKMCFSSADSQNYTLSYSISISGDGCASTEPASESQGARPAQPTGNGHLNSDMEIGCQIAEGEVCPEGSRPALKTNRLVKVVSQASQTDRSPSCEMSTKSTDPLVSWTAQGWECQRCARPPRLPRAEFMEGSLRYIPFAQDQRMRRRVMTKKAASSTTGGVDVTYSRSSSRSSSCSGSSSEGDGVQPLQASQEMGCPNDQVMVRKTLISSFESTHSATLVFTISEVMRHWNLMRVGGCCPFHDAVRVGRTIMKDLLLDPCQPSWLPFSAKQCQRCLSMEESSATRLCTICAQQFPGVPLGAAKKSSTVQL